MKKLIVSLVVTVLVVGCASGPAPAPAAQPSPTKPVVPVSSPAGTPETAKSAPPAPPGYKARVRKGETVYCKTVEVTGSYFPKEVCYTVDALAELEKQQNNSTSRILNKPAACNNNSCALPQGPGGP